MVAVIQDGQSNSRRWWALAALMLGILVIGFDGTILNVAVPTLATSIDASTGELQWILDAYIVVFAGLLLPMGALGDRYGRKLLLLVGLAVFGVASVIATFATGAPELIAARALMGVGAAIISPIAIAVLPVMFPPHERAKAIAIAMMGMGVGVPLGPIVGGYLLDHFWWGSVFLVNLPIVLISLVAVTLLVPESKDPAPRRVDAVGGLLSAAGLTLFVYAVIEAPTRGWTNPVVGVTGAIGCALLVTFVFWERRVREPMIDLRLFARPRFGWATTAATIAGFALFGLLFVLPQYLQAVLGHDAFGVGLRLLPLMVGLIVGAKAGESIAAKVGAKAPIAAGLAVMTGALGLAATTGGDSGYGFAALWLSILGLGFGAVAAPAMDAVLGELPPQRSGSGTAVTMTLRQIGGALGVALLGSVSSAVYTDRLDAGGLPPDAASAASDSVSAAVALAARLGDQALAASAQSAYIHAMDVVFGVCAAVAGLGAILVALFLPAHPADPTSELTPPTDPRPADALPASGRTMGG